MMPAKKEAIKTKTTINPIMIPTDKPPQPEAITHPTLLLPRF